MANGIVVPTKDIITVRTYRNASNSTVIVRRLGKYLRQFEVWNSSLDEIKAITLDSEDRPVTAYDTPTFNTDDGHIGRLRLNGQNGTITGWILSTYGSNTFVTSSSSKTFFCFTYMANASE